MVLASAADLPTKKYLNLAAIKIMAAAAEQEAQKRNVQVTICIVDESGNLLFLQKADRATWARELRQLERRDRERAAKGGRTVIISRPEHLRGMHKVWF